MANFAFDDAGIADGINEPISAPFLTGDVGDTGDATDVDRNGNRFDPSVHSGRDKFNSDGSYRRKRGRKTGSGGTGETVRSSSGRKAASTASVESLSRVLLVLHLGLAGATKTPELALEPQEAEALAQATAKVLEEFDVRPNPKVEAIISLGVVAGSIYGPRMYLIADRRKKERDNAGTE